MVVRLNKPPQGVICWMCPDLPATSPSHHPGVPPDDSRQEANIIHFVDCSEAQTRSVVDHIREHDRHDGRWRQSPSMVIGDLMLCGRAMNGPASRGEAAEKRVTGMHLNQVDAGAPLPFIP